MIPTSEFVATRADQAAREQRRAFRPIHRNSADPIWQGFMDLRGAASFGMVGGLLTW